MSKKKKDRSSYPLLPEPLPGPVVDNHTHLPVKLGDDAELNPAGGILPLEAQIERMAGSKVTFAITCGCEVPDWQPHIDAATRYPQHLAAAIAVHPNEAPLHLGVVDEAPDGQLPRLEEHHQRYSLDEALSLLRQLAQNPAVVAIGETGLDFYRTAESGKEAQIQSFRAHIALAKELDLPLQIHDRLAHRECYEILKRDGAPQKVVFHCFSGDAEFARMCAAEGWYGSFAGPITYPVNEDLRAALQAFPADLVLMETDAPYLTPVPWRGHPNAPYVMAWTVRAAAEVRGVELPAWCEQVYRNSTTVYGLSQFS